MKNKEKKERGGFFKEFKKFITRGNVLDMAVGIIVGGAFTAIITALVNNILTPLLQMIPGTGKDGLGALQVVLRDAVVSDSGEVLSQAVILDFGVVISAIITFLLTAFVLFLIVKIINGVRTRAEKAKAEYEARKKGTEEPEPEPAPAPEPPAPPAPTTEELLAEIRDLLKANAAANTEADKTDKE